MSEPTPREPYRGKPNSDGERPPGHLSRNRLTIALAVAAVSDGLSLFLTLAPPVQWAVDLATALLLFIVMGWRWVLLPALIMEAIPGLYVFPFWLLVVGSVALWGKVRTN